MIHHEFVFPYQGADPNRAAWASVISCPAGGSVVAPLQVMRRGTIRKCRVVQLTGTLEGFSYLLYNSAAPYTPGANPTLNAGMFEKLYRITPLMVVASGQDSFITTEGFPEDGVSGLELAYACLDDNNGAILMASPTGAGNTIFLRIIDGGSSSIKAFGIALTISDPMV